jgi:hypothetical protein
VPTRLWRDLLDRYAAVQEQARLFASLRTLAGLPPNADLSHAQWTVIEQALRKISGSVSMDLTHSARIAASAGPSLGVARALNAAVAKGEVKLSAYFDAFDLLLDVLTQRRVPSIGPLLKGCDVLAADALARHDRLAVYSQPLVFLDRGFGASILREGVPLAAGTTNVVPLIQIPYSKLVAKYGLTSVVHEVGHQALEGLGLVKPLAAVVRNVLAEMGAPPPLQRLFGRWMKELGPDFWGFGVCGVAQAASLREILSLPSASVFRIEPDDPHPPPYIRVLFSFAWCRRQWGRGYWSAMERDWRRLYPLSAAPERLQRDLRNCERYIPAVSRVLFEHRLPQLERRPLAALFCFRSLDPRRLHALAREGMGSRVLRLGGLSPCGQLALFRLIRDFRLMSASGLDNVMTTWLQTLAARGLVPKSSPRRSPNVRENP